jgi:ribosomal protein S26
MQCEAWQRLGEIHSLLELRPLCSKGSLRFVLLSPLAPSPIFVGELQLKCTKQKKILFVWSNNVGLQDKAVKRFMVRNMVETAAIRDLQDASAIEGNVEIHQKKTRHIICLLFVICYFLFLKPNPTSNTDYRLPKFYIKMQYCISCAVHAHIVRVRSADARKIR